MFSSRILMGAACAALLTGCQGGGSSEGEVPQERTDAPVETPAQKVEVDPPIPPSPSDKMSQGEAVAFSQQAAFGASSSELDELRQIGPEEWIERQIDTPRLPYTLRVQGMEESPRARDFQVFFWERAIHGDDQLRQRMTFALSQIVVIGVTDGTLSKSRESFALYADLLNREALGNYCDLIKKVTYTPSMGQYLTHLGNRKADPERGYVPDENYAREVMQLFTIGLDELDSAGRSQGRPSFTEEDVEALAAVMTGLSWQGTDFNRPKVSEDNRYRPMAAFDEYHEDEPKVFLGRSISFGANAEASIDEALTHLLSHPNVAPFISKQLIQKLVSSNPSPDYVRRVAEAFEAGRYTMASGATVGTGKRCDMAATAAAILLDEEARTPGLNPDGGKLRSPILRLASFLRAYRRDNEVSREGVAPYAWQLQWLSDGLKLGHNAFASPSVFNFYRPGYVAPGTASAEAGLVAPEFQIETAPASVGYINLIADYAYAARTSDTQPDMLLLNYDRLDSLADDPEKLVAEIERVLIGRRLQEEVRQDILRAVDLVWYGGDKPERGLANRRRIALTMALTSPDYMVQR
ncbi:DUF1800 domain-containing protein [Parvularcula maris]|uniref:DUF1800 domain-containing protein n=1 Tax=Parvularcula maris TaxID=2965077 RepID=A0A9X2L856_9PROT|nr:DUF1800 domain-containing protein [Parvularcula maris]MCQ8184851.1 DUF1800 domain-containing protein [Parvularcula maris]